ncbi:MULTISPECIES: phosphoribosylglycinamide formyltransferase [Proteus]|jgi:phosphoribosylglycinamide formyltransferase-1|uniref:Phosphoribosylglycinamide formyltransferase n=1 Tax=Proteus vulgaris TaxID=585 RepID=A0A379FDB6_PROVU|nr:MULTISPECIES: phosphoribosylglycinamide formyltransferase [Proteus]NBN60527.1 phosphoribosylglycinamide formyltransferase [Proteus sp. G2639]RNT28762.1 phosphoribosylglycinamide formyltransferase [Proteus mirabilis]AYY81007.1 phosphoribosylglycinamide formyltransferase [Proteus vulgaris]KGA60381.1 phosphoribosylglycinamide formyltransferase [Proteus vulgaris]MBG5971882.1 phosphoribosylglycinamide formyltransferase [Proteus vulgaris]
MKNIVVLISGNGSNLQAIIDACRANKITGNVVAVLSNKANAYGLERAKQADIPAYFVDPTQFNDSADYDKALIEKIDVYQPDIVVLAGFMRILSPAFVAHYQHKLLNIHPSLLPKYPGLHTHRQVLANKDPFHGVTVHFVTEELDGGPMIIQARIPVFPDDTEQSLQARIQIEEYRIYPLAIRWLAEDRLTMKNNQAYLDDIALFDNLD